MDFDDSGGAADPSFAENSEYEGAGWLTDPLLSRLPGEIPQAFQRLPLAEQRWRGRVMLMIYSGTGSVLFAWAKAMEHDDDAATKAFVDGVEDAEIVSGLLGMDLAKAAEARPVEGLSS